MATSPEVPAASAGPTPGTVQALVRADPETTDDHGPARARGLAMALQLGRPDLESVSDDHASRNGRFDSEIGLALWAGILVLGGLVLKHLFSSKSY